MNLLHNQFPNLEGFQSCQYAVQLGFERHDKLFIQIINRSPGAGGPHWLTVSNINCLQDEVCVYDSSFCDLPHVEELVVARLVQAIANATALAFGRDPSTQVHSPRLMREHLIKCLENRHLEPFSVTKGSKSRRKTIKTVLEVPLNCTCKMSDTRTL